MQTTTFVYVCKELVEYLKTETGGGGGVGGVGGGGGGGGGGGRGRGSKGMYHTGISDSIPPTSGTRHHRPIFAICNQSAQTV